MRIGIDVRLNYYRPGGTVEYARQLLQELADLDPTSHYLVIQHIRDRESLLPASNFRRANTLTPSHHRLERWLLGAELRRFRLDIAHFPDSIPVTGARAAV